MHLDELDAQLRGAVARLASDFAGLFSTETIERDLRESVLPRWPEARVKTYVPLLVERFARENLRALARIEGQRMTDAPEVLFVCVHNAGRSQMAAALLDHHAEGRVHVRSAGSTPEEEINPAVVAALSEQGIDVSQEFPKPLSDEFVRDADIVVTMGCGDACPVYPGKKYLDWELPDPAGKTIEEVRPIRDERSNDAFSRSSPSWRLDREADPFRLRGNVAVLTVFGVASLSFMMIMYALEYLEAERLLRASHCVQIGAIPFIDLPTEQSVPHAEGGTEP